MSNVGWDFTKSSTAFICCKKGSNLSNGNALGPSHLALSGFFFGNDNDALITIHMLHRFGAIIVASFLLSLSIATLIRSHDKITLRLSYLILALVTTQVCLGILNIVWLLPIGTAVGHNLIAALLLVSVITLNHRVKNSCGALSND